MNDQILAILILGIAGLSAMPLAAALRSLELWAEARRAERASAE